MPPPEDPPPIPPPIVAPDLAAQTPDLASEDVPCLNCGYNLRGLDKDGTCPECSVPIDRSLHGNLFIYSSPKYVRQLFLGVLIIRVGIIAYFLTIFLFLITDLLFGFLIGDNAFVLFLGKFMELTPLAMALAMLLGWWFLSAPDPAILGNDRGTWSRVLVRAFVVIAALALMVQTALTSSTGANPLATASVIGVMKYVIYVSLAAKFLFAMSYIRWLAPRIPNRAIEKSASRLLWLAPTLVLSSLVIPAIGFLIVIILYFRLLDSIELTLRAIHKHHRCNPLNSAIRRGD